jgi:hypothetical protein
MSPGNPFRAQFESKGLCPAGCGYRIHPGDTVRYDENDELVHDACRPRPDPHTLGPREVVCPDCFLVRPCPCVE